MSADAVIPSRAIAPGTVGAVPVAAHPETEPATSAGRTTATRPVAQHA
ncbi:hypothetical protein ACF073_09545 [Streptomyces sp. NPDC015171]